MTSETNWGPGFIKAHLELRNKERAEAASPVQGAASASEDNKYDCPGDVRFAATSSASGAKGAAVKPWQERMGVPELHGPVTTAEHHMCAEIADWRALADRSPAVQPSGAAGALSKLLERIDDAHENYERMGEVCPFEGQPMIYASTLTEIIELRGEFHVASLATPAPEQEAAQVGAKSQMKFDHHPSLSSATKAASAEIRRFQSLTAPVPATTPAEQPEAKADDQSHVVPPFAAPAGQHGACTVCKGVNSLYCGRCDGMGLEPRKLVGYGDCRCVLSQYCDGTCNPIWADEVASGAREGRDAQGESSGKSCATATNTSQPEGEKGGAA